MFRLVPANVQSRMVVGAVMRPVTKAPLIDSALPGLSTAVRNDRPDTVSAFGWKYQLLTAYVTATPPPLFGQ